MDLICKIFRLSYKFRIWHSSTILLQELRVGSAPGAILVIPNAAISITEGFDLEWDSAREKQAEKE